MKLFLTYSNQSLSNIFEKYCLNKTTKDVAFTDQIEDADVVVMYNEINQSVIARCSNKQIKVVIFREPYLRPFNHPSIKVFHYDNCFHLFSNLSFVDNTLDFFLDLSYPEKNKICSAIASDKDTDGLDYKKRIKFIHDVSYHLKDDCDFYGYGWKKHIPPYNYKGPLESKSSGLLPYRYSICIENTRKKNYFTEKLTDALLCWSYPIYIGSPNVYEYFPKNSLISIDYDEPNVFNKIKDIISRPPDDTMIMAMARARELIMNEYNMCSFLENKLKDSMI